MNKKCQVFTPKNTVIELLDKVGYIENLYGAKVIENACGDGNILIAIVERYILYCFSLGLDTATVKSGLEADIYGAEIDMLHYKNCITNLNLIASKYGILGVKWNILNVDILKTKLPLQFDYIIGNPPYISYTDLDQETRNYVKENYSVCLHGKFDYCYAFIEASLKCLNDNGKLSYLIPSNIFKNVFAKSLRSFMLPMLSKIYDYTTEKLFDNALTSSAIIIADKGNKTDYLEYFDIAKKVSYKINKSNLNDKWIFSKNNKKPTVKKTRFGDYFTASMSVVTLLNEIFVFKKYEMHNEYIVVNGYKIEKAIIREAASPRSLHYHKKELIIYPYYYENEILMRYNQEDFTILFPETTKYLKNYLEQLRKRASESNVQWYEYGKTQALAHMNKEKLLLSTVITKEVKVYDISKDCIPYSGIYIISKGTLPISYAKKILRSNAFLSYVQNIGVNASGTSLRITASDINNFEFSEQEVL